MLYVHTIGRIGKDSQVITGTHGSFIAFDIAVEDYSHGKHSINSPFHSKNVILLL